MRLIRLAAIVAASAATTACASSPKLLDSAACTAGKAGCRAVGGYALPKLLVQVKLETTGGVTNADFPPAGRVFAPDVFVPISYLRDDASNDEIEVMVENGYLKSVKAKADDKTDEIITEVLKVLRAPADSRKPGALMNSKDVEAHFDPLSVEDIAQVNRQLAPFKVCVSSPDAKSDTTKATDVPWAKADAKANGAVWYRPAMVVRVRLHTGPIANDVCTGDVLVDKAIVGPGRTIDRIDIARADFVLSETEINFTNGMLDKVIMKKPSSGYAVATLPYNIAKALIALPTDLIQLKIDTSGKEKALHDARTAEIEARTALLAKLAEVKKDGGAPN